MNVPASPKSTASSQNNVIRFFRYFIRVPLLLLHILIGLPPTMLFTFAPLNTIKLGNKTLEHRFIQGWSAGLMWIFGFRLHRIGTPREGATLFVANHVSWVDIEILHSQHMMGFVAKQEISRWPLVGWMAARGQTIFHQRGSTESLGGVVEVMQQRLREGKSVGVFPEGRTRDGKEVGPFHARIFSAAVETQTPIQPVALRYGDNGDAQAQVAFGKNESFAANIVRILGDPPRRTEIHFLTPIESTHIEGRRKIADLAREQIISVMEK